MRVLRLVGTVGLVLLGAVPFTLGLLAGVLSGGAVWMATAARIGWQDGYRRGVRRGSAH